MLLLSAVGRAQTLPSEFRGEPSGASFDESVPPGGQRAAWNRAWQVALEARRNFAWTDGVELWDDARTYLNTVLDTLLASDPVLRKSVTVDVSSVPWINAEERADGLLLLDLGLLARLQDEAQLAWILGHESAHRAMRHSVRKWLLAKCAASSRSASCPLDTHKARLEASRAMEREADSVGFLLLSRTRWSRATLDSGLGILGTHPFAVGRRPWTSAALPGAASLSLPDSVWLPAYAIRPDTFPSDEPDTGMTHPALRLRREALRTWMGVPSAGRRFLVDSAFFRKLVERARSVLPDRLLASGQPQRALFETWSRMQSTPGLPGLRRTFTRSLVDIALTGSGVRRRAPRIEPVPSGGPAQTLEHFLKSIDPIDLFAVAIRENRRLQSDGLAEPLDSALGRELWVSLEAGWPLQSKAFRDSAAPLPRVLRGQENGLARWRRKLSPIPPGPWAIARGCSPRPLAGRRIFVVPPHWGGDPAWDSTPAPALFCRTIGELLLDELGRAGHSSVSLPDPARWTADSAPSAKRLLQVSRWLRDRGDPRGAERWRPTRLLLADGLRPSKADALLVVWFGANPAWLPSPPKGLLARLFGGSEIRVSAAWFESETGELGSEASAVIDGAGGQERWREGVRRIVGELSQPKPAD